MATFSTILAKIAAIITAQTSYFQSGAVFLYEPEIKDINSDPFASIIPSGNESDYLTTSENKRQYSFVIRIFVERKSRTPAEAETVLRGAIDALLDAFDNDYTLTGTVLGCRATPSKWGYILADKEYRTADINISCMGVYSVTP